MPEFQPGDRVRVREEGGDARFPPDKRWLGKEGTIEYGAGVGRDRHFLYFVEFDSETVRPISGDWLEPRNEGD